MAGLLVAVAVAGLARQAEAQATRTKEEQAAVKVINDWVAAWATKDADKVGSYMAENCVFRLDPSEPALKKGRAAFINEMKMFFVAMSGGFTIKATETFAAGGETGTAVLQKRIDTLTINGKTVTVPLAAFFRVKDGKIQEWLDMPLVDLGPLPGAPGGPGGPGAPGNRPN